MKDLTPAPSSRSGHVHVDMDVDERTAQRTGFISLDKAHRHQLGGVFMDTLHIASETAREFAQADGSSVLLQGLDNRPATLREVTKKGARGSRN